MNFLKGILGITIFIGSLSIEINQIQLQCIGLNGKVYKIPLSIQNGSVKADCSSLSKGVYSLLGKANGKHFNERVIIRQ